MGKQFCTRRFWYVPANFLVQDGRLGMYRCARIKVAQRNSKYHKRGDVHDDDCEVDGDMFYEIIKAVDSGHL